MLDKIGSTQLGVWIIKHVVSPLQRYAYQWTGGRLFTTAGSGRSVLLLTTRGRRTGKERTTPLYYLGDKDRIIICNVNPGFERTNPWVLNLRAHPVVKVQLGRRSEQYRARQATKAEETAYWPRLILMWEAYSSHFERSHQRTIFILEQVQEQVADR